ncbi:MAG: anibiotic ABC transporter [Spirochaetaceae bacterium]|nr:MAG: anibiotic ABC transporter [Spirochaetaceae bacterium]
MTAKDFTGTAGLLRLAIRRDRVKLPIWILGISGFVWIATGVNDHFSAAEMTAIVILASDNPAMRMLVSPIVAESVTEVSRFVFFRFSAVFSLLTVLMSIHAVNRHSRMNEDTGCAEMVGATMTGRYATLAAALTIGVIANVALSVLIGVALIAYGLPAAGSFAAGASFGGLGIVFVGVAALTAQLAGTGSGSNALSGVFFGGAYAVAAFANAFGPTNVGGLGFRASRLAWFTPVGWTQGVYPFDDRNWWLLALFVSLFVVISLCAFGLVNRRDVGRGVFADRSGRASAPRELLSPLGLAWRLQRGSLLSWTLPMVFMGFMLGMSAESLGETMGDTEFFGGAFSAAMAEFPFLMTSMAALAAAIFAMRALLRMRAEENAGPLENVLSTRMTRSGFVASHVVCALVGSVVLIVAFTVSLSISMRATSSETLELITAALFQFTGVFVLSGFVLATFGLFPDAAGRVSLTVILVAIATGPFFGTALNLPDRLMNVSPFTHIAFAPADVSATSIAVLVATGVLLGLLGFVAFARRDLRP